MKNHNLPNTKLLESIFLQSTNVIAITNEDFNNLHFIYVNPAFLKMTGYSQDEIIGQHPSILQGPKTKKDMTRQLKEKCLKGESFRGDNVNYKKDGSIYYVGWTVTPIRNDDGKIINFVSVQKDITEIKKLEKQIIENERLNALENISSGLTHEINTSLTTCLGSLEMLEYDIDDTIDIKSKQYMLEDLNVVKKSIKNIKYITTSLHYLTDKNYKKESYNIFNLIFESLEPFKEKIKNISNCTVNDISIFEDKLLQLDITSNIDIEALKHVFMIIIDNALDELIKHTDITKNIFDIKIKAELSYIQIDFIDNAGGIEKEKQKRIFKPLVKDKELGGLGMGLYIAKTIMDQLNGTLEVKSTKPSTTFTIKINI